MRRILIVNLVFLGLLDVCSAIYGFVRWVDGKPEIKVSVYYADMPDVHVARATYRNEINKTGWAFLEVHTSADSSDEQQAYAAGYLEGYLSRDLIWMHWQNTLKGYCFNKTEICGLIEGFVDTNEAYIADMVRQNPKDPYWYQLKLYYTQLEGLAVGYNEATEDPYELLTIRDIVWLNMIGDLDDLSFALSMPAVTPEGFLFGDHCSGLVKLLPGLSDLYISQVTWNSYQSMLRIQKKYVLKLRLCPGCKERIPGYKMAFSSYPGLVQSLDDFYIMSSGLVSAETTIANSNRTLFKTINPIGQVLEYARCMLANRLASSGEQWVDIFRRHNSGTYNNQWYIVDYKKFRPGHAAAGVLWVLEQLPGYVEAADLTDQLVRATYFPSYNIACFPRVFNLSGGAERVSMFGDWFGYTTNPRAKIFAQRQGKILNLRDMYETMRYNDYKRDPLARCDCRPPYSACNAVAARNDLNPANGSYPFMALGHRGHGGTDAKITTSRLRRSYQFLAVSSPTYNVTRGIPPFQWSKFDLGTKVSHVGHPDLWMFPPILHRWEWG